MADLVLASLQSFVEWNIGIGWHAEDRLDAVADQYLYHISAAHFISPAVHRYTRG
jgi:hypothetical protein